MTYRFDTSVLSETRKRQPATRPPTCSRPTRSWVMIFTLFEGTSEIQRMIVGRALVGANVRPEFVGVESMPKFHEDVQVVDSADGPLGLMPCPPGNSS